MAVFRRRERRVECLEASFWDFTGDLWLGRRFLGKGFWFEEYEVRER